MGAGLPVNDSDETLTLMRVGVDLPVCHFDAESCCRAPCTTLHTVHTCAWATCIKCAAARGHSDASTAPPGPADLGICIGTRESERERGGGGTREREDLRRTLFDVFNSLLHILPCRNLRRTRVSGASVGATVGRACRVSRAATRARR